jgi:hypothetical protein
LILLGVIAGMQGRALASDPCEVMETTHLHGNHGHQDEPGKSCDPCHDKQCPLDHHNHGCFCHGMPLVPAFDSFISLQVPCRSLSRLEHDGDNPPDGPFFSEDKPPLI